MQDGLEGDARRFIWRLLGDFTLAEELSQEAFLALYISIRNGNPIKSLRPFLYRIIRNLCYDELRRRRRIRFISLDDALTGGVTIQGATDRLPEQALLAHSLYREVHEALDQLSELHRQVLILHYLEELSYEEIAQAMGSDIGTVKSRLHYAKRNLRKLLGHGRQAK